jgi:hypothetical protein
MKNFAIFYGRLEYFMTIWCMPMGMFCFDLVYYFSFGMLYKEKSGNPGVFSGFLVSFVNR